MDTISVVFASHNANKLKELVSLLNGYEKGREILDKVDFVLARDFGLDAPTEDGLSFADNALIKAKYVSEKTNLIAISDDSGIVIDELNGDPGIYSARWIDVYGEEVFSKIYFLMGDKNNRKARFIASMCIYFPKSIQQCYELLQSYEIFEGVLEGELADRPRGEKGFAYDKIFVPNSYDDITLNGKTLAEVDMEDKNKVSHRNRAFEKLIDYLFKVITLKG